MIQPDIERIIHEAAGYAGSMAELARKLGITRQTLYATINKQRCRQSTRLLIQQFISIVKRSKYERKESKEPSQVCFSTGTRPDNTRVL